ncbi:putative Ninja family, Jas TPL-binding domain-containing protein [Helianthus annuus]|nr:putative Ninja family, Jas TPL-binding domain-containing protein [Helianthus annuus]KAJ0695442.1 putative Ninja family, Jas TPL-binding domain-containing protein [Helianthus annuus]KAJ0698901.1 putative Ninja family, Jas TPL-binding domain-containing protein [Helianthus annuus]KAJ0882148.1 putative Ninja family, Jas TPL-binding domain-containing protein [Helianthus annuus]
MEDENELMLELSIGGIFANPKPNPNVTESTKIDNRILKDGIRRRKREEKVKKMVDYGSCGSVSGPFVENKEWLEAQIVGQNDDEPACQKQKQEKFGSVDDEDKNLVFRPTACRSFRPYQGKNKLKLYCKMKSNGCSSDGQCSSHQGGASDDSQTNSSNSQLDQQAASTSTAIVEPSDQHQPAGSSKQTVLSTTKPNDRSNPHESSILTPPPKPEPPSSQHQQTSLLARMPCVSTTGNGPNGKTVSGFLYKYNTKKDVSIVCVCHGRSFSPAGFVEHAGGVDIAQPLKHITIYPAAFVS